MHSFFILQRSTQHVEVRPTGSFESDSGQYVRPRTRTLTGALLRRIHHDERGAVSIETMLIIGAIALPILIFLLKFGWPRIRDYFRFGMDHLEIEADRTKHGG